MQLLAVKGTVSDEAESAAKTSTPTCSYIYLLVQKGSFSHIGSRSVTTSPACNGHILVKEIFPDAYTTTWQEIC